MCMTGNRVDIPEPTPSILQNRVGEDHRSTEMSAAALERVAVSCRRGWEGP